MKVNPINNNYMQNKTNFKARFKQNAMFNKCYDVASKHIPKDSLNKFRDLPNHELEILSVKQDKISLNRVVEVFNQVTKKQILYIVKDSPLLEGLINEINNDSWLFKNDNELIDVYNKLTQ